MDKLLRDNLFRHSDGKDRYNSEDTNDIEELYHAVLNADLHIAPKRGLSLQDYIKELRIHQKIGYRNNFRIHVVKGTRGRPWHTHTRGDGCFMCADIGFIAVLIDVLDVISSQYPKFSF